MSTLDEQGCQQLAVLERRHVGFSVEPDAGFLADEGQVFPGLAAVVGLDRGTEGHLFFVVLAVQAQDQRVVGHALNQGMRLDKDQVVFMAASPCTDRLRDAILTVPGIQKAACASAFALNLSENLDDTAIDGRRETMAVSPVDFGFFEVYGLKPLAGRLFDRNRPSDGFIAGSEVNPPVVINETGVKKLGFASPQAALGHSIAWHFDTDLSRAFGGDLARPSEIIGVVPDFTFGSMREPIQPTMFMVGPKVSFYSIALNAKLDGRRIQESLRGIDRVWKRMEGDAPIQRTFVTLFTLRLYIDVLVQGALITIAAVVALRSRRWGCSPCPPTRRSGGPRRSASARPWGPTPATSCGC